MSKKNNVKSAFSILKLVKHDMDLYVQEVKKARENLSSEEYVSFGEKVIKNLTLLTSKLTDFQKAEK